MKRIVILMHEHLRPSRPHYLIDAIADAWRAQGLEVAYTYGPRERPAADLLVAHVDLTRTPPDYVDCIRSYPAVVNRDVLDISKRRISRNLLRGDEDYAGPVIVKTDDNAGGGHECRLLLRRHPVLGGSGWGWHRWRSACAAGGWRGAGGCGSTRSTSAGAGAARRVHEPGARGGALPAGAATATATSSATTSAWATTRAARAWRAAGRS